MNVSSRRFFPDEDHAFQNFVGQQGVLRHGKIQTTLDLYTQEDSDETRAAQGEFLNAVGMSTAVNYEMWVEMWVGVSGVTSGNSLKRMAGTTRLELATSAVTESLADVTYWNLTVLTARS